MKKHRWSIVFLIAVGVVVNYFDRINMSIAMPLLQKEFNLTAGQMGIFLSAFAWSYALLQLPIGPLLDKIGVKWVTRVATVIWTVACLFNCSSKWMGVNYFISGAVRSWRSTILFHLLLKQLAIGFRVRNAEKLSQLMILNPNFSTVHRAPILALIVTE